MILKSYLIFFLLKYLKVESLGLRVGVRVVGLKDCELKFGLRLVLFLVNVVVYFSEVHC